MAGWDGIDEERVMGISSTHAVEYVTAGDGGRVAVFAEGDLTYDAVLPVGEMSPAQAATAAGQVHFDYVAQRWVDGHDHAHTSTASPGAPLMWCSADGATCHGAAPARGDRPRADF